MNKQLLAKAILGEGQKLASIMDSCQSVTKEYFDAGITFADGDVPAGFTAGQVVSVITLLENVNKFFNGESPVNAQYHVTANIARRV